MLRLVLLSAAVWTLSPVVGFSDSYPPFRDQRIVDSKGKYYVLVRRDGGPDHDHGWGPVKVTIAEARGGSGVVKPAKAVVEEKAGLYRMTNDKEVAVRPGDVEHGRVTLADAPSQFLVSSEGLGVVALGGYGINYHVLRDGSAVTILGLDGRVRHSLKLSELLGRGSLEYYHNGCGSVWWLSGAWIDEKDHELVIVAELHKHAKAEDRPIVLVNLDNGKIRKGGPADVLQAIKKMTPGGVDRALDVALEMKIEVAKPHLIAILDREELPLLARLRAAVMLAKTGIKEGVKLIKETSLVARRAQLDSQSPEYDEALCEAVGYAIAHVPDVLGDEGLSVLRDVVKRYGFGRVIIHAFAAYGEKAVVTLVSMLEDQRDREGQYVAAEALGEIGPPAKPAVPSLIKALAIKDKTPSGSRIDEIAAYALGRIGPDAKSAVPALSKLATDADRNVKEHAVEALERIGKSR